MNSKKDENQIALVSSKLAAADISAAEIARQVNAPLSMLGEHHILREVNNALNQLLSHRDTNQAVEAAFRIICEATSCDGLVIFRYDNIELDVIQTQVISSLRWLDGKWQLLPEHTIYFPVEKEEVRDRLHSMMYQGTTTIVSNRQVPPKLKGVLQELDIASYISFRIVVDGAVFGSMGLVTRQPVIPYAEAYGRLLTSFANSVGNFLVRKQAEKELTAQRNYYHQIIDLCPNPIFAKNLNGVFTLVNQAMAKANHKVPEEMIGQHLQYFLSEATEVQRVLEEDQLIIRENKPILNKILEVTTFEKDKFYGQISKIPLIAADGITQEVITVMTDLTEIKKTEQQLRSEKQFSENITNTIPDGILIVDYKARRINYHNMKFPILGFSEAEAPNLFELMESRLHEDEQHLPELFYKRLETSLPDDIIETYFRFQHKEGPWLYFYTRVKVISRWEDRSVKEYMMVIQNVTELKKTEIALQHSESILKATIDALPDLKFRVAKDGTYLDFYESEYESIQPYRQPSVILGKQIRDIMPPDLVSVFMQLVEKAIAERTVQVHEYEISIGDKGIQHRETRVSPVNDNEVIAVVRDISERKRAEQALQESQQRYRNFIEHSHDGIYYMNCGKPISIYLSPDEVTQIYYENAYIEECNEAMAKMYHTTVSELKGTKAIELHGGEHFEENKQSFKDLIINNFRVTNAETIESAVNGELKYFLNHAVGIIQNGHLIGFWGTQQDITEKRSAENALEANRRLLKAIINALPDLKFRINRAGVFTDYYESENESEPPLIHPSEFLGKTLEEVLPSFVAELGMQGMQTAIETNQLQVLEYFLPIGEDIQYYEGRISPLSEEEVIIAIRNITDHKKAEIALQEKIKELDEKNKQLTQYIESNFQLENFAYIASHDLREPVRTMHSFAQLLKKNYINVLEEEGNKHLDFIIYGAENMNRLIDDLLAYSLVNSEEHRVEAVKVSVLLQDVMDTLTRFVKEKKALIQIEEIPLFVQGNPTELRQLFQNLISNAIKFHQPHQPPIVRINGIEYNDFWLFEIKDQGIGVPTEMKQKIFQLFQKIHYEPVHTGTGIGLALCKRIVEHHGGEIWVESYPSQGSSFYFTLKKP